jgi:alkanesulfonate monooxygenase SsuD/methylene tetrahydromethanopterin reductase-like flavin-dependent oxidoreductase (luciferase family)
LAETLTVVRALWSGETVEFEGDHHRIHDGVQRPTPLGDIPIVIGGAGPRTIDLVAAHATWWNCPLYALDRFDALRPRTGSARASTQEMVAFVADPATRDETLALATRRFGTMGGGLVSGDADELLEHYRDLHRRGVERVYVWFADFAPPATLAAFGDQVVAAF